MRLFLIIAGLLLALASPFGASAEARPDDGTVYVTASHVGPHTTHCVDVGGAGECQDIHASCSCVGSAVTPEFPAPVRVASVSERLAVAHDALSNRSLQPPVPPPLA